jgi:hypothetical protein
MSMRAETMKKNLFFTASPLRARIRETQRKIGTTVMRVNRRKKSYINTTLPS